MSWLSYCLSLTEKYLEEGKKKTSPFKWFIQPVNHSNPNGANYARDYFDVVSTPMDLKTVLDKCKNASYNDVSVFVHDMKLIWMNAQAFNQNKNQIYRDSEQCDAQFTRDLSSSKQRQFMLEAKQQKEREKEQTVSSPIESKKKVMISYPFIELTRKQSLPNNNNNNKRSFAQIRAELEKMGKNGNDDTSSSEDEADRKKQTKTKTSIIKKKETTSLPRSLPHPLPILSRQNSVSSYTSTSSKDEDKNTRTTSLSNLSTLSISSSSNHTEPLVPHDLLPFYTLFHIFSDDDTYDVFLGHVNYANPSRDDYARNYIAKISPNRPMCFSDIEDKFQHPDYTKDEITKFAEDMKLIWTNAMKYHPSHSGTYVLAQQLRDVFQKQWKAMIGNYIEEEVTQDQDDDSLSLDPPRSCSHNLRRKKKSVSLKSNDEPYSPPNDYTDSDDDNKTRKRKTNIRRNPKKQIKLDPDVKPPKVKKLRKNVAPKPSKPRKSSIKIASQPATILKCDNRERQRIKDDIFKLTSHMLSGVVEILSKEKEAKIDENDEIEYDLDAYSDVLCWELRKYLNQCDHKQQHKRKFIAPAPENGMTVTISPPPSSVANPSQPAQIIYPPPIPLQNQRDVSSDSDSDDEDEEDDDDNNHNYGSRPAPLHQSTRPSSNPQYYTVPLLTFDNPAPSDNNKNNNPPNHLYTHHTSLVPVSSNALNNNSIQVSQLVVDPSYQLSAPDSSSSNPSYLTSPSHNNDHDSSLAFMEEIENQQDWLDDFAKSNMEQDELLGHAMDPVWEQYQHKNQQIHDRNKRIQQEEQARNQREMTMMNVSFTEAEIEETTSAANQRHQVQNEQKQREILERLRVQDREDRNNEEEENMHVHTSELVDQTESQLFPDMDSLFVLENQLAQTSPMPSFHNWSRTIPMLAI